MAQTVKNLPATQEMQVWFLGGEDPLKKGMATHSSILAWRNPWTEEPGRLQSMGSQRVRRDWATEQLPWIPVLHYLMSIKSSKIIFKYILSVVFYQMGRLIWSQFFHLGNRNRLHVLIHSWDHSGFWHYLLWSIFYLKLILLTNSIPNVLVECCYMIWWCINISILQCIPCKESDTTERYNFHPCYPISCL